MSLCLTADELRELTKRTRHEAQRKVLDEMGIRYLPAPDGSLRVHHEEVRRVMVGGTTSRARTEPDAAALLAWQGRE